MSTHHPTALEWAKAATGETSDHMPSAREAFKAFHNELQGLVNAQRTRWVQDTRHAMSPYEHVTLDPNRYIALQTLYYLTDNIAKKHEEAPEAAFTVLMNRIHNDKQATPELRDAYRRARADAVHHSDGKDPKRTRREILLKMAGVGAAGLGFFSYKTAYDMTQHQQDRRNTPSPDQKVGENVVISGAAGAAGWYAGAVLSDIMPSLDPIWQALRLKVGLPEGTMQSLRQSIDLLVQDDRKQQEKLGKGR